MSDFSGYAASLEAPARSAAAITPNDSTDIGNARALYVGTSGDVAVEMASGADVTFPNVPVGILPVRCVKVLSTGTTASDIVALY